MEDNFADSTNVSASMYLVDKYNEYSIQLIRWFLKVINAWPHPADIVIIEKIRPVFVIIIYFLIISIIIACSLAVFIDPQESFETMLINFGPITFMIIGIVNYSCLLIHIDDIYDCVEHVKADWQIIRKLEDRRMMLKSAKIGRFIAGVCAVFMHSGTFSYNMIYGLSKKILQVGNSSIIVHAVPYPFYSKILNTCFSPAYELVFFMEVLSVFFATSITVATCSLVAVFVMHACGQMKIMISWLENLMDDRSEEKTSVRKRFAIIVNHHLRILSFVSRTEKIMNIICLMELFGCTMHICLLGYYVIMDVIQNQKQNIWTHSMLLFSITFNIFIFCYIGEILSEQGEQIGKCAYMTNWYLLPGKSAQGLILIILRSNASLKITAGKIFQLSFSTFGDVIKSAIAYLNILRTVLIM